ncbi:carbohydrate ABC transporter permease [Halothermothrix orenii]|uniref:Binding-protein-dependent transport systems inner membrane component n=1 Tax=Halothermothrix orenii (strain H 168 / OCM 544 / DSM 9562) TaxID=373903 RepID=B8D1Z0_HALOH|nr:sugar ABC transporter permease [Halothermothrix orenii]ACL69217.1 binding-protein-dependent transport systems inner membrane component [Halothermothrix orenii H 168]
MYESRTVGQKKLEQLKLLLPALIPVILFSLIPLLRGIYLGFTDYVLGSDVSFNGFENYKYMLTDTYFWQSFKIGFVWTIAVTAGQILLGLGLAMLLNGDVLFRSWARVLILIPWAMPPVIRGIMWKFMYHPDTGAINYFLMKLNIIDQPIDFLFSFDYVIPAVIIVGIWGGLPQAAITLLAGLQSISDDYYEAACLDGANGWHTFRYITLPLLSPVMTAITILRFIWNFNSFGLVYVLTQGGPAGMTRIPTLLAYEEGFRYGNVGYAAALGNVMVLVVAVLMFMYLKRRMSKEV